MEKQIWDIPINPKIMKQQAKQTVQELIDAIIELVTNADDSYTRLHTAQAADSKEGQIVITVKRGPGGKARYLEVSDEAEGMSLETIKTKALWYGAQTSGFSEDKPVRGFWGRGLKETIFALGEGKIESVKNGERSVVRVWWDNWENKGKAELLQHSSGPTNHNGTTISINVTEDVKCPDWEKLKQQVSQHYALRDIVRRRKIILILSNVDSSDRLRESHKWIIKPSTPQGKIRVKKKIDTPFGEAEVEIWESSEPLDYRRHDPISQGGIVVKTIGAALDISLFDFDDDPDAHYFFGQVMCPGIADLLRQGQIAFLTATRRGLDWRNAKCKEFSKIMRDILRPLVEEKKRGRGLTSLPNAGTLVAMLNQIISEELQESQGDGEGGDTYRKDITVLTIVPSSGKTPPGVPRNFTLYFPARLATATPVVNIELLGPPGFWKDLDKVSLKAHSATADLLIGEFKVSGTTLGAKTHIHCYIENFKGQQGYDATATLTIAEPGHRQHGDKPRAATGGLLKDIKYYPEKANQRSWVDEQEGVINICTAFPDVSRYNISDYRDQTVPETRKAQWLVMLAEVITDAVCRYIARKRVERGLTGTVDIDSFLAEYNRLFARYCDVVHEWVSRY